MNILIVDNTIEREFWGSPELRKLARLAPGADLAVRRAPERDLPAHPRAYDRIILSGSKTSAMADAPWITELQGFIQTALNENIPLLGVCYGHQLIANVIAQRDAPRASPAKPVCRRSAAPEIGWTLIELIGRSPLTVGLPGAFYSFSTHFEEVAELPRGLRALARSEDCAIQAFQLEEHPVFGIQFHPEREAASASAALAKRAKDPGHPRLLHPEESAKLYDPSIGETLFKNFLGVTS